MKNFADSQEQKIPVERFFDIVLCPERQHLYFVFNIITAGQENNGRMDPLHVDEIKKLESVQIGHAQIR